MIFAEERLINYPRTNAGEPKDPDVSGYHLTRTPKEIPPSMTDYVR
jgi:hypothetical protein